MQRTTPFRWILMALLVQLSTLTLITAQQIQPTLYGQNFWLANGDEGRVGYIDQLWPAIDASGVKLIRLGGNGYQQNMPALAELGARVDSIRSIGAEALMQVPSSYSAEQTSELINYFNGPGKKSIHYWAIGNEPLLHNDFSIEEIQTYILRIAKALKQADPGVKILVFDECEIREAEYAALCGGDLDITGLKEKGTWLIDGFSFHKYPMGTEFVRDDVIRYGPELLRQQIETLLNLIKQANKKHRRKGDAALIWGLTEINVTWSNPNREISGYGNPSFLGGQFIAEMYGLGMEYGAFTVCPWCIHESDNIHTDFGFIGLPLNFYPRSSYWHTQMMSRYMQGEFLYTFADNANVKTIGTRQGDQVSILVMNQDQSEDLDFDLVLNRQGQTSDKLLIKADAGIKQTYQGRIANQSTQLLIFDDTGHLKQQITYSLQDNLSYRPPSVMEY